jgi:hypothetical protein
MGLVDSTGRSVTIFSAANLRQAMREIELGIDEGG